jgi:prepilin-type N-terminal cleavage/methylation domain-containing protein
MRSIFFQNLNFIKNMEKYKGFTLIELLVVMAIIGLLATIVTVNVNNSRSKAQDATIQGTLRNLMTGSALYYENTGSYTNFCSAAGGDSLRASSTINGIVSGGYYCTSTALTFAAYGKLKYAAGKFWCVDSVYKSVQENASSTSLCI